MDAHLNTDTGSHLPAQAASRYVEAGGLRLHYLDYGAAGLPPVLCVHGGGAHAHWFDYIAPHFSADYHLLALDQRGHGESAWADPPAYAFESFASDLAEVAEKLDLRDFVLIGHSMGGLGSIVYAATYPGRLGKLVIVDSSLRMAEDRVAAMRDIGARQGSTYSSHEDFVRRYRLRPVGTTAPADVLRHMAGHATRQADDGTWRHKIDRNVYAQRIRVDAVPYWDRIRVPALLVKGGNSQRITPQIFADVKSRCPYAELVEVPGSDHHIPLDNPAGFARAVKPFLAR